MTKVTVNNDDFYALSLDDGNDIEIKLPDDHTGEGAELNVFTLTEHLKVKLTDHERFLVVNALSSSKDDETMEELIHKALREAREKKEKIRLKLAKVVGIKDE